MAPKPNNLVADSARASRRAGFAAEKLAVRLGVLAALCVGAAGAAAEPPGFQEGEGQAPEEQEPSSREPEEPRAETESPGQEDEAVVETPAPPPMEEPLPDPSGGFPVHGALAMRYRLRTTGGESDQDLYATLDLDVGDPERHAVTGHLSLNAGFSLDGQKDPSSSFFSLQDTFGDSVLDRLYEAYVSVNAVDELDALRVGRLQTFDTPVFLWFDGAYAQTAEMTDEDLVFGGYGGVPVHFYQSSASGDLLYGLFTALRPWHEGRFRFDWMHLEDDFSFGEAQSDLYNLAYWQRIGRGLSLEASHSRLGSKSRDYRVSASAIDPESEFTVRATFYQLLEPQALLPLEIDPLFLPLLTLFPYYQGQLIASKTFAERVHLQGGADVRRVEDAADVGRSNRDVERYFLTGTLADAGWEGLDFSLTGETWNGGSTDTDSWGADLTQRVSESVRASIGSYYSLFKYDAVTGAERDHVRTYYARVNLKETSNLSFSLFYEFENNPFDDYNLLGLGMTWRF